MRAWTVLEYREEIETLIKELAEEHGVCTETVYVRWGWNLKDGKTTPRLRESTFESTVGSRPTP